MFIMGVAIVLSFRALQRARVSKSKMAYKIIRRSAILFLLGLMINSGGGGPLSSLRIPGVLQRFSLAFFAVGFLEMFFRYVALCVRLHMSSNSTGLKINSMYV